MAEDPPTEEPGTAGETESIPCPPTPSPLSQALLGLLLFVELSFLNFPAEIMWGALRESVADIDQRIFEGVHLDGACGDLLSLLAMLCAALKRREAGGGDSLAALGAFSSVLALRVDILSSINQPSALELPPTPASAVVSACIEQIIHAPPNSNNTSTTTSLELSMRTLSLLIRHSPPIRLAVATTNNGVHRNLCRSLLSLLTPSSPANQIILSLSVLPKLVVADELEEKIFDSRNVEKTLGLVFDKIMAKTTPYSVQMVAASIVADLCASPAIVKLVERSERLRPFLVECWVTIVKAGEDLAREENSSSATTSSSQPSRRLIQPLLDCALSLHLHCQAVSQTTFAVLVLRNNSTALQGQSSQQQPNHKYHINVEVASTDARRSSNKGAER